MAVAWPSGVPTCPLRSQAEVEDTLSRFEPEIGPALVRRRTTLVQPVAAFRFSFTLAQFADFETWFAGTAKAGAEPFTLPDPVSGSSAIWQFEGAYSWSEELRRKRIALSFTARRLRFA